MIQISSGIIKGLKLHAPKGTHTRPSSERLRQSLFNILRNFRWQNTERSILEGATVVDLCAGTGAWGFEALSNGALSVCLVESHRAALQVLQMNVGTVEHAFQAQKESSREIKIIKNDVLKAYIHIPQTRLIFCDPPYHSELFTKIDALELQHDRIETGGLFLFEAAKGEKIPQTLSPLELYDQKNYGDSTVHFFVKRKK